MKAHSEDIMPGSLVGGAGGGGGRQGSVVRGDFLRPTGSPDSEGVGQLLREAAEGAGAF